MFVTCLFAILDPATGRIVLANAGHNLPYVRTDDGVVELRATGMPLGLLPDIRYEETEGVIAPGSNVLLYSDGLVEAHDPASEMYGFPRLREEMAVDDAGSELLDRLLDTLHAFTGPDWEQEDDITLVTLRRASGVADEPHGRVRPRRRSSPPSRSRARRATSAWRWTASRRPSADLGLAPARLERLKTAVSEAAMNAIEYGSQGRAGRPGRHRRRDDRRGDRRPDHRPRPVRRRPRRRRGARHRAQARRRAEAARLGPLPDQEHGGFDGRDQRRVDPDGDPDDGTRGAHAMDDRTFGAEVTEVPDEVRVRLQRRPQRPGRRGPGRRLRRRSRRSARAGSASTSGTSATSTAPGIALVVRLLADARARRPDGPGDRPDRALPGDLPDHPPVGLHGDRRRRSPHERDRHRARTHGRARRAHPADRRATSRPASEGDLMAAYGAGDRRRRDGRRPRLQQARVHEQRRHRAAGDAPRPRPARRRSG